ncbi:MAG: hypothetical protein ACJ754_01145 [Pyrinomonadaceae bacterium]
MEEEKETTEETPAEEGQITLKFRYLKSNFFRVIHADGVLGGLTGRGNIHMSFYNERAAIPDGGTLVVSEQTGQVIKPEKFHGAGGIIREVETDVMIDLTTAMQMHAWLGNHIKSLQSLMQEAEAKDAGEGNGDTKKTGTRD